MFRRQPLVTASSALVPNGLYSKRIARTRTEKSVRYSGRCEGPDTRTYCDWSRECRLRQLFKSTCDCRPARADPSWCRQCGRCIYCTPLPTLDFTRAHSSQIGRALLSGSSLLPLRGRNGSKASTRARQTKPPARGEVLATVPSRYAGSSIVFRTAASLLVPTPETSVAPSRERKVRELTCHRLAFGIGRPSGNRTRCKKRSLRLKVLEGGNA